MLVVDDEPDIRFMLRMYLGRRPSLEITAEAANGAQAVAWTPVAGWLLNSVTGSVYFQYYTT